MSRRSGTWNKFNSGGKVGCALGGAASIAGAMSVGVAVGAVLGGGYGEKLDGANGVAVGAFLGFTAVAGMIIVAGAFVGGAVGHALHRFDIWRMLRSGGKVGSVLGVVVATPVAIYLGSAICAAIDQNFGNNAVSDLPMLIIILLLGFTLTMDTVLGVGFGVGATIGHLIHRFVAPNVNQSIA